MYASYIGVYLYVRVVCKSSSKSNINVRKSYTVILSCSDVRNDVRKSYTDIRKLMYV